MKKATLSRRLLAGAAGLAIGLGGMLAVATSAQAQTHVAPILSDVEFKNDCDGTWVTLKSGTFLEEYEWTVWQPSGEFALIRDLDAGETETVFVPKVVADIRVDFAGSPGTWPRDHTWQEPKACDKLKEPEVTPPTCEDSGSITIPDKRRVTYKIDGELAEAGEHTLEPGEYEVTAKTTKHGKKFTRTWLIKLDEPECPPEEEEEEPENGEGGEKLPETGSQVALFAGGALLLLTLGGAMYVVARRRQISFTA